MVKLKFSNVTWRFDKTINGGSSKRRPDILCELETHVLIIEVDEDRHIAYGGEDTRMLQICEDVGGRPVIFIRFNPDKYTDENGKIITSCWAENGNGIMTIKKSKEDEWESRIDLLKEKIQYWIDNIPEKTLEIEHLFYGKDTTLPI